MSVSIDHHPSGNHESAELVLAGWLDDYQAGRCERADMEEAFISVCSSDAEAPWDALSLLDRYQRLGRIEVDVARELKMKISQLAVGAPKGASARAQSQGAQPATRISDEHESESGHTDDMVSDGAGRAGRTDEQGRAADAAEGEDAEEEEEEDEDADDDAAPALPLSDRTLPKRTASLTERAARIRNAIAAREARAPAQTPPPQREPSR